MTYCKNLEFESKPDYGYLKKLLKDAMYKRGHEFDYKFDWIERNAGKKPDVKDFASSKWEETKAQPKSI